MRDVSSRSTFVNTVTMTANSNSGRASDQT